MWTLSNVQGKKINTFQQRCLCCILRIMGNIRLPKKKCWYVLTSPLCTTFSASTGFAGLVVIWGWAKSLLYSWLVVGKRNVGRSRLCYKYSCKRDLKSLNFNIDENEKSLHTTATNHALLSSREVGVKYAWSYIITHFCTERHICTGVTFAYFNFLFYFFFYSL